MITSRIRVEIDNTHGRAERDRLMARSEQCPQLRAELEQLLVSGINPFSLVQLPSVRRNEVRYRSELSEPYWHLLEREAV